LLLTTGILLQDWSLLNRLLNVVEHQNYCKHLLAKVKVILYSYLILKKTNERITDS